MLEDEQDFEMNLAFLSRLFTLLSSFYPVIEYLVSSGTMNFR